MNTIPTRFTKWGDVWTLQKRSEKHALYKRVGKLGRHWDVVGIRVMEKDHTFPSGTMALAGTEILRMSDGDWGIYSWCFQTASEADTRFTSLLSDEHRKAKSGTLDSPSVSTAETIKRS